jgi:hypothetical protein
MKEKEIAILAGNKQQFDYFVRKQSNNNYKYVYIRTESDICGHQFLDYKTIGTFYENKDYARLLELVKIHLLIK